MIVSQYINESLQMFNNDVEKGEVICHLLKSLLLMPHMKGQLSEEENVVVIYLENHRIDKERYFVHQLSFAPPNNVHHNALLIKERKFDLTEGTNTRPSKKWSIFHSKSPNNGHVTNVVNTNTALHRVYDANNTILEKLDSGSFFEIPISGKKDGCLKLSPANFFSTLAADNKEIESITNAIKVINVLYKEKHKDNNHYLKERIFNEIVHTLDLPLIVFTEISKNSANDQLKFRCTYYNESFKLLVQKKGNIGSESLLLESSPQDQRYEDDTNSIFFKFLHHPEIWKAIENVLIKRPLTNKGITRSNSGDLDQDQRVSETIEMKYEDDIFPESHYEFHIYRVNGTRIGIVIRDVSERVHHLQLIEQASRAKTEFLANINHEFRTPLNSIDGNLQLLTLTEPLTARQRELIQRMRLSGTALMSLLQEVLDYAKLEQHKYTLNPENFSLRMCIQESVDVMAAHATNKRNKIRYHFSLDVPTVVFGDSWQLQKVLVNLISNANRFTEDGIIQINVSTQTDMLRFDVIDTGCGIDEQTKKDLFKPWVQSSTLSKGPNKGNGLGLAICKELCTLMGGSIWLEQTQTETDIHGSTFSFLLPLVSAEGSSQLKLFETEMSTLKGKRVLLLHPDNEQRRNLVKSILSWGMLLTTTSSPEETEHFLSAGYTFDVAFLGTLTGTCDNCPKTEENKQLLNLAQTLVDQYPSLPTIVIGDDQTIHDPTCSRLFRKVLESPLEVEDVFHLCVNLFSDLVQPKKPVKTKSLTDSPHNKQKKGNGVRCLIVEDVPENEVVLKEMLEQLGHVVCESVGNGKKMLEYLSTQKNVDVVFVDILMPVMNGIDAVKEYRKEHPINTKPYIVAVSATTLISSENDQHKQHGMDAFLRKPIKLNELKTLMNIISKK